MSKRTGKRCGQRVPGGGVCQWHGRNGAAERNRQTRIVVAEAVAEARAIYGDEYAERDPSEVLLAAVTDGDRIVQKLKAKIELSGELHASDLDALGVWLDRASRMAKTAIDARVEARRLALQERDAERVADAISNILADLGLSLSEPRVMQVVSHRMLELSDGGAA